MGKTGHLYEQVIEVTADYLGPAASRFIDRQISNHLQKRPNDLVTTDMPVLIDWATVAISILTDDSELVQEYTGRLEALGKRG